ncbi:MAG: DNA polymerase IV, partial [Erysipelotrichaceae bacterium]
SQLLFGEPLSIAKEIQDRVLKEVGLSVSIGLSYNKIFAKLGSDRIKKSGLYVITEDNFKEKIWPLDIGELFYVGRATKDKLLSCRINTIGDLANVPIAYLTDLLGKNGEMLWYFANGYDVSEVAMNNYQSEVKSISNGVTTVHNMNNLEETKIVFYVLAESVASRLKDQSLCGCCVQIGLRDINLERITRQCKLSYYTNTSEDIMQAIVFLLNKHYDFTIPLRSISVRVSSLCNENTVLPTEQLNLFSTEDKEQASIKGKLIDKSMDEIRNKYGHKAVRRLVTLMDEELSDFDPKNEHTIFPVGFF